MDIFAWSSPLGNVGDDLNHWLWPRLLGDVAGCCPDTLLVGIGSVLSAEFNEAFFRNYRRKILLGAGSRGPHSVFELRGQEWDIRFVRGSGTARVFGLPAETAISDPAVLISRFLPGAGRPDRGVRDLPAKPVIGFVPYWGMSLAFGQSLAALTDMKYIPVQLPVERFCTMLMACDGVVVEAMHGAIIADSLGVPWVACRMNSWKSDGKTHAFKWQDWLDTMDLAPTFFQFPEIESLPGTSMKNDVKFALKVRFAARGMRKMLRDVPWTLSERALLEHRQTQMLRIIDALKQEMKH